MDRAREQEGDEEGYERRARAVNINIQDAGDRRGGDGERERDIKGSSLSHLSEETDRCKI